MKTEIRTWRATTGLRFFDRPVPAEPGTERMVRTLQQLWECLETGEIKWQDVPLEAV